MDKLLCAKKKKNQMKWEGIRKLFSLEYSETVNAFKN